MTLLSITASFGALVWIFQEGNLSSLLDFEPLGYTIAGNPIIMFSVIFGLSMDYEVLLLSRIQEAYRRTGDNTTSVAEGLAEDGRRHHRRGPDHGHGLLGVRPGRGHHDQEHRRRHGHRGRRRRHDHPGPPRAGHDAADGRLELVGAGPLGRLADRLGFSHVEDEDAPVVADRTAESAASSTRRRHANEDRPHRPNAGDPPRPRQRRPRAGESGHWAPGPDVRVYTWEWGPTRPAGPACRGSASSSSSSAGCCSSSSCSRGASPPARWSSLAVGLAFLIKWAIDRGTGRSTPGRSSRRLAAPGVLNAAGVGIDVDGIGTFCFGVAFLFIAAVRARRRRRRSAGRLWFGGLLALLGGVNMRSPDVGELIVPIAAGRPRRRCS